MRDFYQTLGVERSASQDEIKHAFRKLAFQYHPDRNNDTDAEQKCKEVIGAYAVLGDVEKRRLYDQGNSFNGSLDEAVNRSWEQYIRSPPFWTSPVVQARPDDIFERVANGVYDYWQPQSSLDAGLSSANIAPIAFDRRYGDIYIPIILGTTALGALHGYFNGLYTVPFKWILPEKEIQASVEIRKEDPEYGAKADAHFGALAVFAPQMMLLGLTFMGVGIYKGVKAAIHFKRPGHLSR